MSDAALTASQPSSNGNGRVHLAPGENPHFRSNSGDVNRQGKHIQELLGRIESLEDAEARGLFYECLQSLLAMHGDGLARILQLVKNAGDAGAEINDALIHDKLVRGLLLIHGLHPVPLEKRLLEALDKVRPYMQSHGGNVELLELENDKARLRLQGTCKSCPSSAVTLELAVRQAVEEACPDLLGFEVEGVVAQSASTTHTPAVAPAWTVLDHFDAIDEGETRLLEVGAVPVLFAKTGGSLYAYRNHCPACKTAFLGAYLESRTLHCHSGHRFDVQRAGLCPDNPEIHLEPFPLLAANGVVRISVR